VLGYVCERKRTDDLVSSIVGADRRYTRQKAELLRCGLTRILYIIESNMERRLYSAAGGGRLADNAAQGFYGSVQFADSSGVGVASRWGHGGHSGGGPATGAHAGGGDGYAGSGESQQLDDAGFGPAALVHGSIGRAGAGSGATPSTSSFPPAFAASGAALGTSAGTYAYIAGGSAASGVVREAAAAAAAPPPTFHQRHMRMVSTASLEMGVQGMRVVRCRDAVHTARTLLCLSRSIQAQARRRTDWALACNALNAWAAHVEAVQREAASVRHIWGNQLSQFRRIHEGYVEAIAGAFPTPALLLDAYDRVDGARGGGVSSVGRGGSGAVAGGSAPGRGGYPPRVAALDFDAGYHDDSADDELGSAALLNGGLSGARDMLLRNLPLPTDPAHAAASSALSALGLTPTVSRTASAGLARSAGAAAAPGDLDACSIGGAGAATALLLTGGVPGPCGGQIKQVSEAASITLSTFYNSTDACYADTLKRREAAARALQQAKQAAKVVRRQSSLAKTAGVVAELAGK
jgi:hypothetical protein